MKTIDEQIKKYLELNAQKEELEEQMNSLKLSISDLMQNEELDSATYTTEDRDATVTKAVKETFKYSDERAMIEILKSKNYSQFVAEKIITTSLNKELKKGGVIAESLKGLYSSSTTEALTIKHK